MGWVDNATPRQLYPRETNPVPIVQEAGWAPGPVWTGDKNLVPTEIRSPERPVRSESLYRLSYFGSPRSYWMIIVVAAAVVVVVVVVVILLLLLLLLIIIIIIN